MRYTPAEKARIWRHAGGGEIADAYERLVELGDLMEEISELCESADAPEKILAQIAKSIALLD